MRRIVIEIEADTVWEKDSAPQYVVQQAIEAELKASGLRPDTFKVRGIKVREVEQ